MDKAMERQDMMIQESNKSVKQIRKKLAKIIGEKEVVQNSVILCIRKGVKNLFGY